MNLWLRLLWTLLSAWAGRSIALPQEGSRLTFRVWPHDLDPSLHMNNGRYLTLMDLGRLDILARSGLMRATLKHKWTPIASTIKIRFRRELRLFDRFRLETQLLSWESHHVIMQQTFVLETGRHAGQVAAQALFKGGLYDRQARTFVPVEQLMAEIGVSGESPAMAPEVEAFRKADEELRRAGADRG